MNGPAFCNPTGSPTAIRALPTGVHADGVSIKNAGGQQQVRELYVSDVAILQIRRAAKGPHLAGCIAFVRACPTPVLLGSVRSGT